MEEAAPPVHVLLIPFLGRSRALSMVGAALLLARRGGVRCTIVSTAGNSSYIRGTIGQAGIPVDLELVPFPTAEVGLPAGVECTDSLPAEDTPQHFIKLYRAMQLLQHPIEKLIVDRRPDIILFDYVLFWYADIAQSHSTPFFLLDTMSPFSRALFNVIWDDTGALHPAVCSPGSDKIGPLTALPHPLEFTTSEVPVGLGEAYAGLLDNLREISRRSCGVLLNSFEELTPEYLEHCRGMAAGDLYYVSPSKLMCIGPVQFVNQDPGGDWDGAAIKKWLDSKPPESVVYVSFGSECLFSAEQLREIAVGLQSSGHPFVWVVRGNGGGAETMEEWLPQGFRVLSSMALKAVHVSDVPNLDHVPEMSISTSRVIKGVEIGRWGAKPAKFMVIGHRGKGMNLLSSPDPRMKAVKENSVISFNEAGRFPVDFVEFDVQVTRDNCPIIFHDNFILTEEYGNIVERRATDLCLEEFLSYGPQREPGKVGKKLLRKLKDGRVFNWNVETDYPFCTLEEAFKNVDSRLGFNVELKFDDNVVYQEKELTRILRVILQVIFQHAGDRPIIFSSFQPDAARLMRKLQNDYHVYFLTNGGNEIYADVRRNSLDEAIRLCLASGMHGIVSESRAIFRNPSMIPKIKESNLALLTYGQLNNVAEAVYMQHLMGIDGVIVDLVEKITEAASDFTGAEGGEGRSASGVEERGPKFSERELSFLLKLIPELVQV